MTTDNSENPQAQSQYHGFSILFSFLVFLLRISELLIIPLRVAAAVILCSLMAGLAAAMHRLYDRLRNRRKNKPGIILGAVLFITSLFLPNALLGAVFNSVATYLIFRYWTYQDKKQQNRRLP